MLEIFTELIFYGTYKRKLKFFHFADLLLHWKSIHLNQTVSQKFLLLNITLSTIENFGTEPILSLNLNSQSNDRTSNLISSLLSSLSIEVVAETFSLKHHIWSLISRSWNFLQKLNEANFDLMAMNFDFGPDLRLSLVHHVTYAGFYSVDQIF